MRRETAPLEKALTGIDGFDEMTYGGLPQGRTTLVTGGAGSGKTVFALQTLVNGARYHNEPGIFVAFEENSNFIRQNARSFGWDLDELEKKNLFLLDARLPLDTVQGGDYDLSGILAAIEARTKAMGAHRIVFDAIDILLMHLEDPMAERREIYRLHEWLIRTGLTGIITAKRVEGEGYLPERYEFIQFMADCALRLTHQVEELSAIRKLRIIKYRGSGFIERSAPFMIGAKGIEVATANPMSDPHQVSNERVSTGLDHLDGMLDGGYYRGTNILITGAPGTAKSTLAGAFVEAACQRGENALFISFDENANEIVRNLASVNIQLGPHVEAGQLKMYSTYTGSESAEALFLHLQRLIATHQATCIVIDPISGLLKSGGLTETTNVAHRLLYTTKRQGITTVCTSLQGSDKSEESVNMKISSLADTWIHLAYQVQGGERNRALSIVKSRGTGHSNQVRELLMSDSGILLSDVYTAGGEVLMGTLRWEREEGDRREQERQYRETEQKRRELELARAETKGRLKALELQLNAQQSELAYLAGAQQTQEHKRQERHDEVHRLRQGGQDED